VDTTSGHHDNRHTSVRTRSSTEWGDEGTSTATHGKAQGDPHAIDESNDLIYEPHQLTVNEAGANYVVTVPRATLDTKIELRNKHTRRLCVDDRTEPSTTQNAAPIARMPHRLRRVGGECAGNGPFLPASPEARTLKC